MRRVLSERWGCCESTEEGHLPEAREVTGFLQVTSELHLVRSVRVHQEKKEEEEESQDNSQMTNGARTRDSRDKSRAQTEK